jgi:hypothetical protein
VLLRDECVVTAKAHADALTVAGKVDSEGLLPTGRLDHCVPFVVVDLRRYRIDRTERPRRDHVVLSSRSGNIHAVTNFSSTNKPRRKLRVSAHAADRFRLRVSPAASPEEALRRLEQMAAAGRLRSRPRHWTNVEPAPGLRFLYWAELPHVCGLVLEGVIVTVLTRDLCRRRTRYRAYDRDRPTRRYERITRRQRLLELERRAA